MAARVALPLLLLVLVAAAGAAGKPVATGKLRDLDLALFDGEWPPPAPPPLRAPPQLPPPVLSPPPPPPPPPVPPVSPQAPAPTWWDHVRMHWGDWRSEQSATVRALIALALTAAGLVAAYAIVSGDTRPLLALAALGLAAAAVLAVPLWVSGGLAASVAALGGAGHWAWHRRRRHSPRP